VLVETVAIDAPDSFNLSLFRLLACYTKPVCLLPRVPGPMRTEMSIGNTDTWVWKTPLGLPPGTGHLMRLPWMTRNWQSPF